jgi:pre-mRNA-processing factor 19
MSLICAISNEVPENPVISPVSGSVFERRLIEKYLADNANKDPVSGELLTADMLIEIKTPPYVKAKLPSSTSIPGILKSLQDEWDAVMLHSFTMRQQLQTARQELSHAMYQHDAACRVIARLTKEVTSAREALATLKPQHAYNVASQGFAQESDSAASSRVVGVSQDDIKKLNDTAAVLTAERKKKSKIIPDDLTSSEEIQAFRVVASHSGLHSASTPGILCLDMHGSTVVTGGTDKVVTVFDKDKEEITSSLRGHLKKVMQVVCHPTEPIVLSGSLDATVRIWHATSAQAMHVLRVHDGPITGLSLHATGDYVFSASMDRYWAFADLRTGAILAKVLGDSESALTSAKFHPDGLICATGTLNADVKIWDLKEQVNVANFPGHEGPVTTIAFSENGYYLATGGEDSTVRLWDLRKLRNFKTIELDDKFTISDLDFDQSGSYLAVIGNDLRIYGTKTWNDVAKFGEHSGMGTGVRFGVNASFIASTSMDRTLKFYSSSE